MNKLRISLKKSVKSGNAHGYYNLVLSSRKKSSLLKIIVTISRAEKNAFKLI
jgi:hypothetical protein